MHIYTVTLVPPNDATTATVVETGPTMAETTMAETTPTTAETITAQTTTMAATEDLSFYSEVSPLTTLSGSLPDNSALAKKGNLGKAAE